MDRNACEGTLLQNYIGSVSLPNCLVLKIISNLWYIVLLKQLESNMYFMAPLCFTSWDFYRGFTNFTHRFVSAACADTLISTSISLNGLDNYNIKNFCWHIFGDLRHLGWHLWFAWVVYLISVLIFTESFYTCEEERNLLWDI